MKISAGEKHDHLIRLAIYFSSTVKQWKGSGRF